MDHGKFRWAYVKHKNQAILTLDETRVDLYINKFSQTIRFGHDMASMFNLLTFIMLYKLAMHYLVQVRQVDVKGWTLKVPTQESNEEAINFEN